MRQTHQATHVRVVVDSRNYREDRLVPKDVAEARYGEGYLCWSNENQCYLTPINNICPHWLEEYPRIVSVGARNYPE